MADPRILSVLEGWRPALPLAVAYSGGADSTALLWACSQRFAGQVAAFHINHGLQAAATDFAMHCQQQCAAWGIPLHIARVAAHNAPGQSPEDAARIARYKALEQLAHAANAQNAIQTIVLAQHADDQVETVLLALSRGAGVAGLAGMRPAWEQDGVRWERPYLAGRGQIGGAQIRADLRALGIEWVEDPTNADLGLTRNRIRALVAPALAQAFPQFASTLARSAANAAQAAELLDELAHMDLQATGRPPAIKALQALSVARMGNVLRYWLRIEHCQTPSSAQLAQLVQQLQHCTTRGHQIHLKVGLGTIQRRGGVIDWYNPSVLV
ncbi:tRNA(Ile)-lysidine synthase [Comamonas odontotermitis]|uniref:tRNA(Ile)-lysidine synthase n=1 Tax=Comamonas odontotermitis TaxID=379895 RepID=A0ABR6RFV1_9BURK|nr:tRNA lysidine(34) synthetase TilS [Comamonas odontotermitis]MBB6577963.1 tRNA(Ile)-lysidine synthase [Comamonas odontotermitis]